MGENLFWDNFTASTLSAIGNPLKQLSALVEYEIFLLELKDILVKKDFKLTTGRPQFDVVRIFKVIFLQRYYSFVEVLKLTTNAGVYDSNVIKPLIKGKDKGKDGAVSTHK